MKHNASFIFLLNIFLIDVVFSIEKEVPSNFSDILYSKMKIYKDPTNKLNVTDISKLHNKHYSKVSSFKDLVFNHEIHNYWLKITIDKTNRMPENLIIYPLSFIDEFEVYVYDSQNNKLSSAINGPNISSQKNALKEGRYGININFKKHKSYILYLRIKPFYLANLGVQLVTRDIYNRNTLQSIGFWGFFYGALLILLTYSYFSYYSSKDNVYLTYCVFLIISMINSLVFFTPLQALSKEFYYSLHNYMNITVMFFAAISYQFLSHFLDLKNKNFIHYKKVKYIISILLFACIPMYYIDSGAGAKIGEPLVGISIFVLLYFVFVQRNHSKKATFFLLVGYSSSIIAALILIFNSYINFLHPTITDLISPVCTLIQVFLMSVSLTLRMSDIRNKILNDLKNNEEILQLKVIEQTDQILTSEKFSAVGRMARGVAHEINNPLMIMQGNIRKTKRFINETSKAFSPLTKIGIALDRVALVVTSFLDLAETSENSSFETQIST